MIQGGRGKAKEFFGVESGVGPDEGLAVRLAPVERKLLFEHLDEQTIIPPPKREKDSKRLQFEDRQLTVALQHLRRIVDKGE